MDFLDYFAIIVAKSTSPVVLLREIKAEGMNQYKQPKSIAMVMKSVRVTKALAMLVTLLGLGWWIASACRAAVPSVLTSEVVEHLPHVVPCNRKRGGCWEPTIGMPFQWQLSCDTAKTCVNLKVHVPFYVTDWQATPKSTVAAIHRAGAHVYCYVDIGSWEDYRPDAEKFPASVLGKIYVGWPKERWLDIRQLGVLAPIMIARMKVCARKGFDGVEFDNVDGWNNATGFPLTRREDAFYTAWMANEAHSLGLSASWENAVGNIPLLEPYMQALFLEQCFQYRQCKAAEPMIQAGKWVGGVEYKPLFKNMNFCRTYSRYHIAGMFKKLALKSYRVACPASE